MSDEGKRLPQPSRHEGKYVIIQVPPSTPKKDIEKQIHDALAEQPQDIFARSISKELVIVVQEEGWDDELQGQSNKSK
jgi:hypothetical protein